MQIASIAVPPEYRAAARLAHELISGSHGAILIAIDDGIVIDSKWGRVRFPIPRALSEYLAGKPIGLGEVSVKLLRPMVSLSLGTGRVTLPDFSVITSRFTDPIGYRLDAISSGFVLHLRGRVTGIPLSVNITIPEGE